MSANKLEFYHSIPLKQVGLDGPTRCVRGKPIRIHLDGSFEAAASASKLLAQSNHHQSSMIASRHSIKSRLNQSHFNSSDKKQQM